MSDSDAPGLPPGDLLELMDWKRRVLELYRQAREASDLLASWQQWRRVRDELFSSHPQTPVRPDERASFRGHPYFEYDRSARVTGRIHPAPPDRLSIVSSVDVQLEFIRFATVSFELLGHSLTLKLY